MNPRLMKVKIQHKYAQYRYLQKHGIVFYCYDKIKFY